MKLLLIDGNSIINRAFYGIKTLTTKDGRYTNAIYGFFNIFLKQLSVSNPDYVAVAFDLPGGTFRNRMFGEYKAGRRGMPQELAEQLPVVKQLLELLGYKIVTCPDFEADDILGTLSLAAANQGAQALLLTGDRDSLQLVSENVSVLYASAKMGRSETMVMDEAAVMEKYGVSPLQLIDAKALMGDSSDNIPGVRGIGEKTAMSLIAKFGSLDGVYENIDDPAIKPAQRRNLTEEKETAYLSRDLAEIRRDIPIETDLVAYTRGEVDSAEVVAILNSLEMHSLIEKMDLGSVSVGAAANGINELKPASEVPFADMDTVGEVALIFDDESGWLLHCGDKYCTLDDQQLKTLLGRECDLFTNDSKALYHKAMLLGLDSFEAKFDISLAGYLLNPSASDYSVKTLAAEYAVAAEYQMPNEELALVLPLSNRLKAELEKQGMLSLLEDIEQPLAHVLAQMEREGFLVDTQGIEGYGEQLREMAANEQKAVYDIAGHSFNLNSPKQLGTVLFEELGLPAGRKTRTGYSTDAETLEKLRGFYPIVDHVLRYRSYQKLCATYVDGLLAAADIEGRIHTQFRQTETRTGRISSVNPNLQNIPIRTELGSQLRRFFVAGHGNVLLDADYSQIELRVLSSMSNDENMINAFIGGNDVHTETASEIFKLPREMITSELRRRAKAVNFGIVYGIGAYSLSQDVGVSVNEASQYIDNYMKSYNGISAYLNKTIEDAKRDGYVTTMYGRRRYIPELQNSNKQVQALGRRLAMNTPVQGTAADIIKIAMIRVSDRLRDELPQAKLILQVHDELIVECPEKDAQRAAEILKEAMVGAANLAVPLIADVHIGKDWYEAK